MTFRVLAYNKAFQPLGPVGDPIFVEVTPRWFQAGVASVAVRGDHHLISALMANGARLRIVDDDLVDQDTGGRDSHFMSGFVTGWSVEGPARRAIVTFEITDDFLAFSNILGWVVPSGDITEQGSAGTNWEMQDDAETVLKTAMQLNAVDRLGLPIHIPATQGRGSVVKAKLRFQSIADRLFATEDGAGIENAGIGVGLRQLPDGHPNGPGLVLDVWTPRTVPQVINEDSGIIEAWSTSHTAASVTRAVVSGEGESTLRLMRARADAAREAAIGWKYEAFSEAGQTDDPNEMYDRADEVIAEGAPKSGLSISLSESDNFIAHPTKLWIGDQVTMQLIGEPVTDRLNEVRLTSTAGEGNRSLSQVGDVTDDPDRDLVQRIRRMARKLRIKGTDTV